MNLYLISDKDKYTQTQTINEESLEQYASIAGPSNRAGVTDGDANQRGLKRKAEDKNEGVFEFNMCTFLYLYFIFMSLVYQLILYYIICPLTSFWSYLIDLSCSPDRIVSIVT